VRELVAKRGLEQTVSVGDSARCGETRRGISTAATCGSTERGRYMSEYGDGWEASLTTRTYCFSIPRSGSTSDDRAELQSLDC
jgi:hypothetical protein